MPNTREIRRRIKSVKSTAQITKAMQMVAAAKMRGAQQTALAGRPYAIILNRTMVQISRHTDGALHPLLEERPIKKSLVVLVSTDRGLCGPLNTNLLREAAQLDAQSTDFVVIGRKGRTGLKRLGRQIIADFELKDPASFRDAKPIIKFCTDCFLNGSHDAVSILYPRFRNTLSQEPINQQLLPIASIIPPSDEKGLSALETVISQEEMTGPEFIFEPSVHDVLSSLLPHYINYCFFQMILSARASEHSARMVAMKNATDNAKELIKRLTLEYNKVRQASITNEILEISSAQLAMS